MSMVIFIFITLGLLWLFQVVFLEEFYGSIKKNQIYSVMGRLEQLMDETDSIELKGLPFKNNLYAIARNNDVAAIVTDENGQVYYNAETFVHQQAFRFLQTDTFKRLFEKAALHKGESQSLILENRTLSEQYQPLDDRDSVVSPWLMGTLRNGQSIINVKMVENESGDLVAIIVLMEITPVNATVETLKIQLILVSVLMLIVALLIAGIIARQIARPIVKITKAARDLGKGKYSFEAGKSVIKEVEDLNETMDYVDGELSKIEGLRKEFIANISHDLRTPLTMIKGYSEVMRDIPGENSQENIQVIIDETDRLHTLVNDILELSKMEEQNTKLQCVPYNFTASVQEILRRYQQLLGSKGYVLSFEYDQEVTINADELRISQVIYNLINNGVTYTGKDKKIFVTQEIREGRLRLEVRDTGTGIPDEKINDIWDRYYKVENDHKRAQVGSGLGLSIVKTIIEKHDGSVGVKSSKDGTVFWFELSI